MTVAKLFETKNMRKIEKGIKDCKVTKNKLNTGEGFLYVYPAVPNPYKSIKYPIKVNLDLNKKTKKTP